MTPCLLSQFHHNRDRGIKAVWLRCLSREELPDEQHDEARGDHAAEEDVLVALLPPLHEAHDGGGHADRRRDVLHLPLEPLEVSLALVAQRLQHRLPLVQQVVHAAVRSLEKGKSSIVRRISTFPCSSILGRVVHLF